jgi:hypothetical protein
MNQLCDGIEDGSSTPRDKSDEIHLLGVILTFWKIRNNKVWPDGSAKYMWQVLRLSYNADKRGG